MKITSIYKTYSDNSKFVSTDNVVELKEYQDDLIFYSPMNDLRAEYALYDKIPTYTVKPSIFTGGPFGAYLKISDDYSFNINNFSSMNNTACVSFYAGANKVTDLPTVGIIQKSDYPEEGLPAGDYSLTFTVDGEPTETVVVTLTDYATPVQIRNKFLFKITADMPFEVNSANNQSDRVVFQSKYAGRSLKIASGTEGTDLLDYFDVKNIDYGTGPASEITIFELFNLKVSHYRDVTTGSPVSTLRFTLTDGDNSQEITVPWNNDAINLDNIEIDFDENVVYIFINGELVSINILTVKLEKTSDTLNFHGTTDNPYSFDEVIIYKECKHTKSFIPSTVQLTKYSTEKPYMDLHFAGSEIKSGMSLISSLSNNIHCCICDGNNFYYYLSGSWRRCLGDFNNSNDWYTFSDKIKTFDYSGNDLFIRCFFFSDGTEKAYLTIPYFELDDELYEDESGNTSAILIGTLEIEDTTEDLLNKILTITTDQGTTEIEFVPEEKTATEYKITADEAVEIINSYYPDGIAKCYKDSKNRLVLVTENKGSDAYIKVSGEAAPLLFGDTTSANGVDADSGTIDYTEFYDAVRTYTSKLMISEGEVSNDQMRLFLKEALAYYKKWRATETNQYTCNLKGDWETGFEIPSVIESQKDIIDILFCPIFPITFYGDEMCSGNNDNIFALTLAQGLFGSRGVIKNAQGITQDYYISLMSMADFKQALGLNPSWQVLNNRLYIFPSYVSRFTKVSILYKAPLSEEECLKDPDIIKYVHGKCLMTMGNVRGQYGSNLTSGETNLTFNADSLYTRGKEFVDEVIKEWKEQQPPLKFFLG